MSQDFPRKSRLPDTSTLPQPPPRRQNPANTPLGHHGTPSNPLRPPETPAQGLRARPGGKLAPRGPHFAPARPERAFLTVITFHPAEAFPGLNFSFKDAELGATGRR